MVRRTSGRAVRDGEGFVARHVGTFTSILAVTALLLAGIATADPGGEAAARTTRGVSQDSIRVVLYLPREDDPVNQIVQGFVAPTDSPAEIEATIQGLVGLFEANLSPELPRVELITYIGTGSILDSVAARADAVTIAEELEPFMVWSGPLLGSAFADELAARGVMCIQCITSATDDFYAEHAPYVWSLQPTPDQVGTHVAEYIDKRLVGRPASFAGDPEFTSTARRFGLIFMDGPYVGGGMHEAITAKLDDVGVELATAVGYSDPISVRQVQSTLIGRLKDAGVTTVIYAGDPLALRAFMAEASAQEYHPEWLMTGVFVSEFTAFARDYDPNQMRSAFGITPLPSDPKTYVGALYEIFYGEPPPASESLLQLFAPPALFYAALRLVGPSITPERFAQALFDAPALGGDATNAAIPLIDFGTDTWTLPDYAGIDDFTEIWWDADFEGPDERGREGRGRWEFANGGLRYRPGTWPEGPPDVFGAGT